MPDKGEYKTAFQLYKASAEKHQLSAMLLVADILSGGVSTRCKPYIKHVQKDEAKAVQLWKMAANPPHESPEAMYRLARSLVFGVPPSGNRKYHFLFEEKEKFIIIVLIFNIEIFGRPKIYISILSRVICVIHVINPLCRTRCGTERWRSAGVVGQGCEVRECKIHLLGWYSALSWGYPCQVHC